MRFTIIHVRHCHMLKTSLLVYAFEMSSGLGQGDRLRFEEPRLSHRHRDPRRGQASVGGRVGSGGLPVGRLATAAGGGASEAGAQGGRPHGRPPAALDLDRAWLGAGGGGLAAQHGASGSERGRKTSIWPFRSVSGLLNPFKAFSDQFNDSFDGF